MKFKQVKIHPGTYSIQYPTNNAGSPHGETDTDSRVISIYFSNDMDLYRDTLLHEILHALLSEIHYFQNDDIEEDFVRRMTPRLLAFLQDNPKITKWLVNEKEKSKKP